MEFFEFIERGVCFEVQALHKGGPFLLLIRPPGRDPEVYELPDLEAVGKRTDLWLAKEFPETAGEGFQGLVICKWKHEEGIEGTVRYPTRGSLLPWFDDGHLPTAAEAASLAACCGDIILRITDNSGNLLYDDELAGKSKIDAMTQARFGF
jgi:hypothetical protein